MKKFGLAVLVTVALTSSALAQQHFALITAVDADKGTIVYKKTAKKDKGTEIKATLSKDCVIRFGYYILGKPAVLEEGEMVVNGLRNFVFEKASAEKGVRVNIYTADNDDQDKGIKRGDVVKILVNPPDLD